MCACMSARACVCVWCGGVCESESVRVRESVRMCVHDDMTSMVT